ncbi:MAG: efflux RND transporter permease subunit [Candidatus Competibacteraceae bacterium]|nr:efflux RND transporter permease subunit [Candidatus Competibacteraceae bacterium]
MIAILIMLGGLALTASQLRISRCPHIAPTNVRINANYSGADAQMVENSVTQVLEAGA